MSGPITNLAPGALALDIDHVSFAYEEQPVLRDVCLYLNPGETLGILGRTGSGKTTISRLVFRLHDPTSGAIRLGGVDIRDLSLDNFRAHVGLVTQEVQLFAGTLRENVSLFDDAVADQRIIDAFQTLGLTDWLEHQGLGLDTRIGSGGRGLSAGESQLVALARVFLKDPGLVVLDEASSRLDPETLALTERGIARLLVGRTGVVIAHRLETVDRVDTILILDGGRVVESGRRTELEQDPQSRLWALRHRHSLEVLA